MASGTSYAFGDFRLDEAERRLVRGGAAVHLTPKAHDLLVTLVRHAGRLVTKEALLAEVWPDAFVEEGILAVHVSTLRKALGDASRPPAYIETVARSGYRFIAPVTTAQRGQPSSHASRPLEAYGLVGKGRACLLAASYFEPPRWSRPFQLPRAAAGLEARGHQFRTRSDTEVLRAPLKEKGADAMPELRGMFALAAWDTRDARAAAGARSHRQEAALLVSRCRAACTSRRRSRRSWCCRTARATIDPEAPRPLPRVRGDSRHQDDLHGRPSPAARVHADVVGRDGAAHRDVLGGRLDAEDRRSPMRTPRRRLRELILDATRARLIADVPIGAFLSGGVDSSIVVAAMAECSSGPVRTFSIGFPAGASTKRRTRRTVAAEVRDRARGIRRRAGRGRDAPEAGVALRPAVRRFVGPADLLRQPPDATARDGRADRRRRRRVVRRIRTVPRPARARRSISRSRRLACAIWPTRATRLGSRRVVAPGVAAAQGPTASRTPRAGRWTSSTCVCFNHRVVRRRRAARLYTAEFARRLGAADAERVLPAAHGGELRRGRSATRSTARFGPTR